MSLKYPDWRCCDTIFHLRKEEYDSKNFTEQEIQAVELYKEYYSQYINALGEKSRLNIDIDIASKLNHSHTRIMKQLEKSQLEDKMLFLEEKLAYLELRDDIQSVLDKVDTPRNIIETTFADDYFGNTEEETNERCEKVDKPIVYKKVDKPIVYEKVDKPIVKEQDNNLSKKELSHKKKEFNQTIFWKIAIPVILMALLLLSILDLEYGYYQFLRIAVFVGSIAHGFICAFTCRNLSYILVPIAVMALVWNPISPLYLSKDTWVICDIIGAIVEAVICVLSFVFKTHESDV